MKTPRFENGARVVTPEGIAGTVLATILGNGGVGVIVELTHRVTLSEDAVASADEGASALLEKLTEANADLSAKLVRATEHMKNANEQLNTYARQASAAAEAREVRHAAKSKRAKRGR